MRQEPYVTGFVCLFSSVSQRLLLVLSGLMPEGLRNLIAVFLGAGASAHIGYPPMAELEGELRRRITDRDLTDLYGDLLRRADQGDAETVLRHVDTVLSLTQNGMESMFKDSEETIWSTRIGNRKLKFTELVRISRELQDKIRNEIFDIYGFRVDDVQRKLTAHKMLFSILDGFSTEHWVFTTNYDRVMEQLSIEKGYDLRDGFPEDPLRQRYRFRPSSWDDPPPKEKTTLKLFKLHGSLNWKLTEFGPEKISIDHRTKSPPDLLIYPGSKDPPDREPFKTLYDKFETSMKTTDYCLVIGFSFRDPYLNRVFRDFVFPGNRKLFVMSRSCENVTSKNLLDPKDEGALKRLTNDGRLVMIPCNFSDDDWSTALSQAFEKHHVKAK